MTARIRWDFTSLVSFSICVLVPSSFTGKPITKRAADLGGSVRKGEISGENITFLQRVLGDKESSGGVGEQIITPQRYLEYRYQQRCLGPKERSYAKIQTEATIYWAPTIWVHTSEQENREVSTPLHVLSILAFLDHHRWVCGLSYAVCHLSRFRHHFPWVVSSPDLSSQNTLQVPLVWHDLQCFSSPTRLWAPQGWAFVFFIFGSTVPSAVPDTWKVSFLPTAQWINVSLGPDKLSCHYCKLPFPLPVGRREENVIYKNTKPNETLPSLICWSCAENSQRSPNGSQMVTDCCSLTPGAWGKRLGSPPAPRDLWTSTL